MNWVCIVYNFKKGVLCCYKWFTHFKFFLLPNEKYLIKHAFSLRSVHI